MGVTDPKGQLSSGESRRRICRVVDISSIKAWVLKRRGEAQRMKNHINLVVPVPRAAA